MEVKEPMVSYNIYASANVLRGKILNRVEQEDDVRVLQLLYSYIQHVQSREEVNTAPKYSLSSLAGILKGGMSNSISYEEMREQYLNDKYSI